MTAQSRHEELQKALAAYPISMLQDFVTFSIHCERLNIKISEVIFFIRAEIESDNIETERAYDRAIVVNKLMIEKFPYCPICKRQLVLEGVNDNPSRIIDDHSKCWWVCSNRICDFDPILSDQHPNEILYELGIPVYKKSKPLPSKKRQKAAALKRERGKRRQKP